MVKSGNTAFRSANLQRRHADTIEIANYRQSSANTCGPASLRIALRILGLDLEETWLAARMEVTSLGTKPSGFRKVLRSLGLGFTEIHNATVDEVWQFVRKGFPVVVSWMFRCDGHYSVVVGITHESITLAEPYGGSLIQLDNSRFEMLWYDPCNKTTAWMMAIGAGRHKYR